MGKKSKKVNKDRTIFEGEGLWLLLSLAIAHCVVFYLVDHYQENLCFGSFNFGKYVHYLVGYGFALWLGSVVVAAFYRRAWETFKKIKNRKKSNEDPVGPTQAFSRYIGIVERAAYVTAFIYEQYGFVAVWLAVKVAISWKQYYEGGHLGREKMNSYLLHTLLSLGYAFIGWFMIKHNDLPEVIILPIVVVVASYLVWRQLGKDLAKWESEWLPTEKAKSQTAGRQEKEE